MTEAFRARLGTRLPIIQAPMAGVSNPQLAAAVSNAGGLGSIAIGASTPEQGRKMLAETRSLTDRPFNVNVFCHRAPRADASRDGHWLKALAPLFTEFDASPPTELREIYRSFLADRSMLDLLLAERPPVVSFHFGLPPASWIEALHKVDILVLACVTNLREMALAESAGVDALVAQGWEAGGHRGVFDPDEADPQTGTFALLQLLVRQSKLPVIAAGGIMDGRGIRAALDLGAVAAQMGTAFVLCPESSAGASYRAALAGESNRDTRMMRGISGRPARGIVNRLIRALDRPGLPPVPDYPLTYDATKQLVAAASARDNTDLGVYWAGQAAPLVRAMPAAELVAALTREMGA